MVGSLLRLGRDVGPWLVTRVGRVLNLHHQQRRFKQLELGSGSEPAAGWASGLCAASAGPAGTAGKPGLQAGQGPRTYHHGEPGSSGQSEDQAGSWGLLGKSQSLERGLMGPEEGRVGRDSLSK